MLDVRNPAKMLADEDSNLRRRMSEGDGALRLRDDPAFQAVAKSMEAEIRRDLESIDPLEEPNKLLRAQIKLEVLKEFVVNLNFTAAEGQEAAKRMDWLKRLVERKRRAN